MTDKELNEGMAQALAEILDNAWDCPFEYYDWEVHEFGTLEDEETGRILLPEWCEALVKWDYEEGEVVECRSPCKNTLECWMNHAKDIVMKSSNRENSDD